MKNAEPQRETDDLSNREGISRDSDDGPNDGKEHNLAFHGWTIQ